MSMKFDAEPRHGQVEIAATVRHRTFQTGLVAITSTTSISQTVSRVEALRMILELWRAVVLSGDISDQTGPETDLPQIICDKINRIGRDYEEQVAKYSVLDQTILEILKVAKKPDALVGQVRKRLPKQSRDSVQSAMLRLINTGEIMITSDGMLHRIN